MELSEAERSGSVRLDPLKKRMVGLDANYIVVPYAGDTSGLKVFGTHVLVRMDVASETSRGGIIFLDTQLDQKNEAATTGHIVAMGPDAFQVTRNGLRWDGERPEIGQRVYIEKYAGVKAIGSDGAGYRIMEDTCIACVITDDILRAED